MLRWTLRAGAVLLALWNASASLSAAELSPAAQVDALFSAWDKPTSPGSAVAVMQDGKIVYEHGYGMADLDHDIPITPDTVFHVASVSKQFTAGSILLLAAEGKLDGDYLTIFTLKRHPTQLYPASADLFDPISPRYASPAIRPARSPA